MEYGEVEIEMNEVSDHSERRNVLIVDDVIATGETIIAARKLCLKSGYIPHQTLALINLKGVNKKKFEFPVKYLFEYIDE